MMTSIKKIVKPLTPQPLLRLYSAFAARHNLGGGGERVVIDLNQPVDFSVLDMYQKSHIKRYEFAATYVQPGDMCGDFACGTGYGTVMLTQHGASAVGADINGQVIKEIQKKYKKFTQVSFVEKNLLDLDYTDAFTLLVSFETVEHFYEKDIPQLFDSYYRALKKEGTFIFSTPYLQESTPEVLEHSFHLTFNIDEQKIRGWLQNAGFSEPEFFYQNYETHTIAPNMNTKDFIIGVAHKRG